MSFTVLKTKDWKIFNQKNLPRVVSDIPILSIPKQLQKQFDYNAFKINQVNQVNNF